MVNTESYKILSGTPLTVEDALNRLADEWTPVVWGITPATDGSIVTCVLLSTRLLQRAQLFNARQLTPPVVRQ